MLWRWLGYKRFRAGVQRPCPAPWDDKGIFSRSLMFCSASRHSTQQQKRYLATFWWTPGSLATLPRVLRRGRVSSAMDSARGRALKGVRWIRAPNRGGILLCFLPSGRCFFCYFRELPGLAALPSPSQAKVGSRPGQTDSWFSVVRPRSPASRAPGTMPDRCTGESLACKNLMLRKNKT